MRDGIVPASRYRGSKRRAGLASFSSSETFRRLPRTKIQRGDEEVYPMKRSWRARGVLTTILLLGAGAAPAAGADPSAGTDWPRFRGPQQNGVSLEKGLLRSWPESGPKVLWKKPIGSGFSSLTTIGDALYTMAVEGESEMAYRLRESDGEVVWRVPLGPVFPEMFGNGPRSTPMVEGDVVYMLSATG